MDSKEKILNDLDVFLQQLFDLKEINEKTYYSTCSIQLLNWLKEYQYEFGNDFEKIQPLFQKYVEAGLGEEYVDFTSIFSKVLYDTQRLMMRRLSDLFDENNANAMNLTSPVELSMPLVMKTYFYDFMNVFVKGISPYYEFKVKFWPEFIPEMINEKVAQIDDRYKSLIDETERKINTLMSTSKN